MGELRLFSDKSEIKNNSGLVEQITFMDELAQSLGLRMPLESLIDPNNGVLDEDQKKALSDGGLSTIVYASLCKGNKLDVTNIFERLQRIIDRNKIESIDYVMRRDDKWKREETYQRMKSASISTVLELDKVKMVIYDSNGEPTVSFLVGRFPKDKKEYFYPEMEIRYSGVNPEEQSLHVVTVTMTPLKTISRVHLITHSMETLKSESSLLPSEYIEDPTLLLFDMADEDDISIPGDDISPSMLLDAETIREEARKINRRTELVRPKTIGTWPTKQNNTLQ